MGVAERRHPIAEFGLILGAEIGRDALGRLCGSGCVQAWVQDLLEVL